MQISSRIFALLPALVAIASCMATAPTYTEYTSSMSAVPSGSGRVFVYRIDNTGNTLRPAVLLDDESIGRAVPDEFFYVDLPVGNYEISISTEKDSAQPLRVRAGETKYVRLDIHLTPTSWDIMPVLVDAATGEEELVETHYAN